MAQTPEQKHQWYLANKGKVLARSRTRQMGIRTAIRTHIAAHLAANGCVDCGEGDPVVLDFDHLGEKLFNISEAVNRLTSIPKLAAEMAKCVVRCANCHRRKTHGGRSYRSLTGAVHESAIPQGDAHE